MKKLIKSRIFAFILGAVMFSGITGVVAYTLLANDIGFTPSDTTWKQSNGEDITNVGEAIDELYNKVNKKIKFDTPLYDQNFGDLVSGRNSKLDLSKGKYLVLAIFGLGSGYNSPSFSANGNDNIFLNCNNCKKTKISGQYYEVVASSAITNTNVYSYGVVKTTLYYVEIDSDSDNVQIQWNDIQNNSYIGEIVALQAVKITN